MVKGFVEVKFDCNRGFGARFFMLEVMENFMGYYDIVLDFSIRDEGRLLLKD